MGRCNVKSNTFGIHAGAVNPLIFSIFVEILMGESFECRKLETEHKPSARVNVPINSRIRKNIT